MWWVLIFISCRTRRVCDAYETTRHNQHTGYLSVAHIERRRSLHTKLHSRVVLRLICSIMLFVYNSVLLWRQTSLVTIHVTFHRRSCVPHCRTHRTTTAVGSCVVGVSQHWDSYDTNFTHLSSFSVILCMFLTNFQGLIKETLPFAHNANPSRPICTSTHT